jgi:hypothetical protein
VGIDAVLRSQSSVPCRPDWCWFRPTARGPDWILDDRPTFLDPWWNSAGLAASDMRQALRNAAPQVVDCATVPNWGGNDSFNHRAERPDKPRRPAPLRAMRHDSRKICKKALPI